MDASGNGLDLISRGDVPCATGVGSGIAYGSATVAGEVIGTGRVQIHIDQPGDAGTNGEEYRRFVLSVRRNGSAVAFFRDGTAIGTATLDAARLGPSSGLSRIFGAPARLGTPAGYLDNLHAAGSALSDAETIGLAARFSIKPNRTTGVGPLAVHFDATRCGLVDPMLMADYQYLWSFVRASDGQPHDDWVAPWGGQGYAKPTGFYVSQVFDAPGDYDAYLAVLTPPYDKAGDPQDQTVLLAGKVATITVEDWPAETTTYYIDPSHPSASNANAGTSPDLPWASADPAASVLSQPYVRVLLRRGTTVPTSSTIAVSGNGPTMVGSYGDASLDRPVLAMSSSGTYDAAAITTAWGTSDTRAVDLTIDVSAMPPRSYSCFATHGANRVLVKDVDGIRPATALSSITGTRFVTLDGGASTADAGYTVYAQEAYDLAITRRDFTDTHVSHFLRLLQYCRVHLMGNYRSAPLWTAADGWTPFSFFTLRHDGRYAVVTDTDFPCHLDFSNENDPRSLMNLFVQVERCNFAATGGCNPSASEVTVRDCSATAYVEGSSPNIFNWRSAVPARQGYARGGRCYHNQFGFGNHASYMVAAPGGAVFYGGDHLDVYQDNDLIAQANGNDTGTALTALPIAASASGGGLAVLLASGQGSGGTIPRWCRWMRRPAGSSGPFEPIDGQVDTVLADLPPGPGSFEYRLDLVDADKQVSTGAATMTLAIPSADRVDLDAADYILIPPVPASGLVGQPSGPFSVTLGAVTAAGPVTIIPSADGPGAFSPASVLLTPDRPAATFSFIPTAPGAIAVSASNDAGLAPPPPVTYTATVSIVGPIKTSWLPPRRPRRAHY